MICKYSFSQNYVDVCGEISSITGAVWPNTTYSVALITTPVTGYGSYTSYLSQCDADNSSYALAWKDSRSKREGSPCKYRVSVVYTTSCPIGSITNPISRTGTYEHSDVDTAYTEAAKIASGQAHSDLKCYWSGQFSASDKCGALHTGSYVSATSQANADEIAAVLAYKKADQANLDKDCGKDSWCGIYGPPVYGG